MQPEHEDDATPVGSKRRMADDGQRSGMSSPVAVVADERAPKLGRTADHVVVPVRSLNTRVDDLFLAVRAEHAAVAVAHHAATAALQITPPSVRTAPSAESVDWPRGRVSVDELLSALRAERSLAIDRESDMRLDLL
jgi:hypothetical protein